MQVFSWSQILDQIQDFIAGFRGKKPDAVMAAAVAGFITFLEQTSQPVTRHFVGVECRAAPPHHRFGRVLGQSRLQLHRARALENIPSAKRRRVGAAGARLRLQRSRLRASLLSTGLPIFQPRPSRATAESMRIQTLVRAKRGATIAIWPASRDLVRFLRCPGGGRGGRGHGPASGERAALSVRARLLRAPGSLHCGA